MNAFSPALGLDDAVLWFGIFAALLLATAVLVRFRDHPAANLWLLVFLLTSVAGILLKFISHNGLLSSYPHLYKLNHPIGLCRPVSLYLYLSYLLHRYSAVRPRDLLHFLPVVAIVVYLWPVYALPAAQKAGVMNLTIYFPRAYLPAWYPGVGVSYSLLYWGLSARAYLTSDLRGVSPGNRNARLLRRSVVTVLVGSFLFLVVAALTLAAGGRDPSGTLFFQYLSALMIVACLMLLVSARSVLPGAMAPRYEKSTLTTSDKQRLAESITRLFEVEKLHRTGGLRLSHVSEQLGVPSYALSQAINEELHTSFTELVSVYRVEAAKELLRSDAFAGHSMEGIGQEAGFRSRASFYSAFKRVSGMTPARYREDALAGRA